MPSTDKPTENLFLSLPRALRTGTRWRRAWAAYRITGQIKTTFVIQGGRQSHPLPVAARGSISPIYRRACFRHRGSAHPTRIAVSVSATGALSIPIRATLQNRKHHTKVGMSGANPNKPFANPIPLGFAHRSAPTHMPFPTEEKPHEPIPSPAPDHPVPRLPPRHMPLRPCHRRDHHPHHRLRDRP